MLKRSLLLFIMPAFLVFMMAGSAAANPMEELLGSILYFDENLSNPPGQSCASCHVPKVGFADPDKDKPVSEGVILGLFGGRNAPTAAYAAFSPVFGQQNMDGELLWVGGQFWDGRSATLKHQAMQPFLNPVEMNNTKEGVVKAVKRSHYDWLFKMVYGPKSLNDVDQAYELVAQAIAVFEQSRVVNRFTSKYDYYLKGYADLTRQEMRGLALFNDPAKGNCAACHPSTSADGGLTPPLFTDFTYDNLGVPKNPEIAELLGRDPGTDYGLGVTVNDPLENGKFKVSTLRNIAKTAPYAHNGYFKTLKDIVHFYNTRDVKPWPKPEYRDTMNTDELGNLGLTSKEEDDIVVFLKTLSDGYVCSRCWNQ